MIVRSLTVSPKKVRFKRIKFRVRKPFRNLPTSQMILCLPIYKTCVLLRMWVNLVDPGPTGSLCRMILDVAPISFMGAVHGGY